MAPWRLLHALEKSYSSLTLSHILLSFFFNWNSSNEGDESHEKQQSESKLHGFRRAVEPLFTRLILQPRPTSFISAHVIIIY